MKQINNYIIVVDSPYTEKFIDDLNTIGELSSCIFLMIGNKDNLLYLKTIDKIYCFDSFDELSEYIQALDENQRFFVHWYDSTIAELFENNNNELTVFLWGGEMYGIPFWHHANWLFDKKTFKYVKNAKKPKINININFKKTLYSILKRIRYEFIIPKVHDQYIRRLKQIRRINSIACIDIDYGETELIRKLYPGSEFKVKPFFFNANIEDAKKIKFEPVERSQVRIMLGNSATQTNNHIDAIDVLSRTNSIVICPLSYGSNVYGSEVIQYGYLKLGTRFEPSTQFLMFNDYLEYLINIDIFYFFHNRPQALGNILVGVALGKPIFLKKINPIHNLLKIVGISVYDAEQISNYNLNEVISQEFDKRLDNIEKLEKFFSEEKRLLLLKNLLTR